MIGVIHSNFWTSIWNPTKWPFILFVLKSRNSPIKRLFILLVKKRRDVRCYYKFWTSIWNPIKWPFILLPFKRRFRNCSLFPKSTKLTIFKHCCDLDGLKAQQEKGLIHLITHRFAASLVKALYARWSESSIHFSKIKKLWKFCKKILPSTMDEQIAWRILGWNLQLIYSFPTHYQLKKYNQRIIIVLPYWPNIQRQHCYLA